MVRPSKTPHKRKSKRKTPHKTRHRTPTKSPQLALVPLRPSPNGITPRVKHLVQRNREWLASISWKQLFSTLLKYGIGFSTIAYIYQVRKRSLDHKNDMSGVLYQDAQYVNQSARNLARQLSHRVSPPLTVLPSLPVPKSKSKFRLW